MLLWQPATVFNVVYLYLCHCLTWQINSLSLSIRVRVRVRVRVVDDRKIIRVN